MTSGVRYYTCEHSGSWAASFSGEIIKQVSLGGSEHVCIYIYVYINTNVCIYDK